LDTRQGTVGRGGDHARQPAAHRLARSTGRGRCRVDYRLLALDHAAAFEHRLDGLVEEVCEAFGVDLVLAGKGACAGAEQGSEYRACRTAGLREHGHTDRLE